MRITQLVAGTAASLALLTPLVASAGWHAVQEERAIGDGPDIPKEPLKSDIYFEDGRLRIDQGPYQTMIYDFAEGRMTMISHPDKQFISQSLDDMKAMKAKLDEARAAQMASLHDDVRKELDEKIKTMEKEKAEANKPKATGKKDKVGKFACDVYAWKSEQGVGEMCVSKKPGVDLSGFVKATEDFSKRLAAITGEGAGAPGGLVEMARLGFPVRTRR
jgi:hypothetical protein